MIQVTFLCSNAWFKYFVNIVSCNYKPVCKLQDFSSLYCWVLVENMVSWEAKPHEKHRGWTSLSEPLSPLPSPEQSVTFAGGSCAPRGGRLH